MKPMLKALRDDPGIELQLVLTDQHLDPKFGTTIDEVRREFDVAATVPMDQRGDLGLFRAEALGRCVSGISDVLDRLKPDICVLYGDRGEVLAAALAATTMGVPIAHLQGGDVSGSVDDPMRHAVTKLSHLHMTSNAQSAERVLRMGEEPWRVHVIGDNHIDEIISGEFAKPQAVYEALKLDPDQPILVVLQHSETTAPLESFAQMTETLLAVKGVGHQAVVIYPCSDAGYAGIVRAIVEHAVTEKFRVHVNLDAEMFWGLLNVAAVLIGNSSAGIIETPSFRLPAVNIGRRQIGRLCAENVLHVPHERAEIVTAIRTALEDENFRNGVKNCSQPYGEGRAGINAVEILKNAPLGRELFVKKMAY